MVELLVTTMVMTFSGVQFQLIFHSLQEMFDILLETFPSVYQ